MSEHGSPSSPDIFPSWALLSHSWTGGEGGPTPSAAASCKDQGGSRRRGGSYGGAGVDGGTGLELDLLAGQLTHVHWPTRRRIDPLQ